jgi:hypothetical protein
MVDMVTAKDYINGSMHFNSGNFCSAKLHHIINMVDMVVLDDTKRTAHTANNATLFTMVDVTAADYMAAYFFFQPTVIYATAYSIAFHLSGTLYMFICEIMLIVRIKIFAQRNTGTLAV